MSPFRRLHPAIAALLLAAALVLRAGVPSGWMPVAGEDGLHVAICTGEGAQSLALGADGRLHRQAPGDARDPCPFGLANASGLDLAASVVLPAAPMALPALTSAAPQRALAAAARFLHPPARGPPAFA